MKPSWMLIVLIASLGFNVFFAGGYWRARQVAAQMQTFTGRAEQFAVPLHLTADQQRTFDRLVQEAVQLRTAGRQADLPRTEAFLAELAKDHPDEQALLDYAQVDTTLDYRRKTILMMRDFLQTLTPRQKETFLAMLREKKSSGN